MQNLINDLTDTLKNDERLVIDGKLVKNKIVELALAMDEGLIKQLLSSESIKKHFFKNIGDVLVFDKVAFQSFVSNKQFLPDSYTAFKNKIGLTANKEYLTESKEVVLAWPYKDCVLEGGQTKEDQKRKEIFWNETLAPDEIDRLLEPKVLTNFKKYDKNGEHKVDSISLDDNLIIKGNNLLALHSLKKTYEGKVKLIYIDPPYNTGSDSFGYNDSFNHSTWLTFIKNRLLIAKELLKDDGSIWINIDDNESHYLKVLCDEILGKDNFVTTIVWQKFHSVKSNAEFNISKSHDNILVYVKNPSLVSFNKLPMSEDALKVYKNPDNDPRGRWRTAPLTVSLLGGARGASYAKTGVSNGLYKIIAPNGKSHEPSSGRCWFSKSKIESLKNDNRIWWGKDGNAIPMEKIFLNEKGGTKTVSTFWNHNDFGSNKKANDEMKKLFSDKKDGELNFSTPKPEKLISSIIEIASNKGDLVLDFFAGSGTTAAVSLKLHRKFIACEQMNYVDKVTINRLIKVINGENGGISKYVEWIGGGSFTYFEIAQINAQIIEEIESSKTAKALINIWDKIKKSAYLSYKINPESIDQNIHEFEALPIEEQKQFLIEVLDKNQLYVNYSDIDDEDHQISDKDKILNKQFYGEA